MPGQLRSHFPRPSLAQDVLQRITAAPRRPLVLAGADGIGKTQWIKQDLLPLAREQGWTTVTLQVDAPEQAQADIVRSLIGALPSHGATEPPSAADATLESALEGLRASAAPSPVLLLLDDTSAWTETADGLGAFGRLLTALNRLPSGVSIVLIARPGPPLDRLIDQHASAGLKLSPPVEIPPLGDDFLNWVASLGGHHARLAELTLDDQRRAFDQLLRRPGEYLTFIEQWLSSTEALPFDRGVAQYRAMASFDRNYAQRFMRCTPMQRQLLVAIARGQQELFSVEARQAYASALALDTLSSVADVDAQLKHLEASGWIIRAGAGLARYADDAFALWVRALADG